MDILQDTTESNVTSSLELDRFKEKLRGIWSQMLKETYNKYHSDDEVSEQDYMVENALKFADEPEEVSEIDMLMDMLDSMAIDTDEQEEIKTESKAPTYKGGELKSNKEASKVDETTYKDNLDGKTGRVKEESKTVRGGSYDGVGSGVLKDKKDAPVTTKYSPLIEELKEELRSLKDRQRIGRRKMRFRL